LLTACESPAPVAVSPPPAPPAELLMQRAIELKLPPAKAAPAAAAAGGVEGSGGGEGEGKSGGQGGDKQPSGGGVAQAPPGGFVARAEPHAPMGAPPKAKAPTPAPAAVVVASPKPFQPVMPAAKSREQVRQQEVETAKAKAKLALAAVPEAVDIPEKVAVKIPDNAALRETWAILQGEWEQSDGAHAPDCVEGGYTQRKLSFGADGILTIRQQHGPDRALTRTMDFTLQSAVKMQIGKERKPDAFLMTKTAQTVHGASGDYEILPPCVGFPAAWEVVVSDDKASITLDGKVYRRAK
jgi:hypothetical protein